MMDEKDREQANSFFQKGIERRENGDLIAAAASFVECLKMKPDWGAAWANLASVRRSNGQVDAALALNLRALEHHNKPDELMENLINAIIGAGRSDHAFDMQARLAQAYKLPTALEDAQNASILFEQGRPRSALPYFDRALAMNSENHKLRQAAAMTLFQVGAYNQAFEAFEARWLAGNFFSYPKRAPRWDGSDLKGKKVIIIGEQGLGDILFLTRFIPRLANMNPEFLEFAVRPPLIRLLEQLGLCDKISSFPYDLQPDGLINGHDIWLPAFDMMRYTASDPSECLVPLSFPNSEAAEIRAKEIVKPHIDRFKIGIVWKSEVAGERHAEKSVDLNYFLSLCEFRGVQLFSLHKGEGVGDIEDLGASGLIIDAGSSDKDLADTAALMKELNLIITIDTAAAHLAGSMGVPTWLLLPEPPHWYWWHPGDVSQFYPNIRLIRQSIRSQWDDVFARIRNDLGRIFN